MEFGNGRCKISGFRWGGPRGGGILAGERGPWGPVPGYAQDIFHFSRAKKKFLYFLNIFIEHINFLIHKVL